MREEFLRMIREDPENDMPRLIFADWLEEQGDPHGELIRVQCQLAHERFQYDVSTGVEQEWERLVRREQELLVSFRLRYVARLSAIGCSNIKVRRGFVDQISCRARIFTQGAQFIVEEAPLLRELMIRQATTQIRPILGVPELARIPHLSLASARVRVDEYDALFRSPTVTHLRGLNLSGGNLGYNLEGLARSPYLRNLEVLNIGDNRLNAEMLQPILDCDMPLKELVLRGNPLGMKGLSALIRWPGLSNLRLLNLHRCTRENVSRWMRNCSNWNPAATLVC